MLLKNKTAVITGCNRGIGKAILTLFAENGANIWACVRTENQEFSTYAARLAGQYDVAIIPVYFDLSDSGQIKKGMQRIMRAKQSVDILVNSAGAVSANRLFQMTPLEDIKNLFETNFFSQILITQYISRMMVKQQNGSIVNLSSVTALDGDPAQLEYVASKAAIIGATKKLAKEFGINGIRVNAVAPGLIDTDMAEHMEKTLAEKMVGQTALKRRGTAQEIAKAVLFLASDLSGYITGQVLRVDGGM